MGKRKVTFKLDDDQVAIVGYMEDWRHLANLYECLAAEAGDPKDMSSWLQYGAWIRSWISDVDHRDLEWE